MVSVCLLARPPIRLSVSPPFILSWLSCFATLLKAPPRAFFSLRCGGKLAVHTNRDTTSPQRKFKKALFPLHGFGEQLGVFARALGVDELLCFCHA